ncbi:MAG: glycosyltransferase, partial [Chloroflexaceae bacterium]|nr:glycosyltransferase [Chloroflexaceae bacterium]
MKVVMLSKALVTGAYQKKLEELARCGEMDLLAVVPPAWDEPRVGRIHLERQFTQGYRMEVLPMMLNGQHHLHWYRGLHRLMERERPEVFHIDEESFNLATFLAMRAGVAVGARCCFFNWANNERTYPWPFGWFEAYTLRHAACAITGNQEAANIVRKHGYTGPVVVLPQFGVDPDLFAPDPDRRFAPADAHTPFIIGYMGRFVPEKGILDLLTALQGLPPQVQLQLVGSGEFQTTLERQAWRAGLAPRLKIVPTV